LTVAETRRDLLEISMSKVFLLACVLMLCATAAWAQNAPAKAATLTNISFKEISAKESLKNLARNLSLNIAFDESLTDAKISFQVSDVTLAQAMDIVLVMRSWRAKQKEDGTILVFADDATSRKRFENYQDWTHRFQAK
jgi:hypothetical protein